MLASFMFTELTLLFAQSLKTVINLDVNFDVADHDYILPTEEHQ